jgi:hypothetical protein
MRKRYGAIATSVAAMLLVAAPGASAFVREEGVTCEANASAPNWTLIGFNPRRIYPVELGELPTRVITRWGIQVAPGKGPLAQQLIAFKQVGEEEDRKTGESAVETVSEGANEFATRIPIEGLNPHVGLHGPAETFYCAEQKEMLSGVVQGAFGIGETRHYEVKVGIGTPITVTIEPDRDGDGYGDLTQDKCPWGYSFESDCPITLSIPHTMVKPHSIVIEAGPSGNASLQVFGQVSWRLPPTAGAGRGGKTVTVGLSSGSAEKVAAGTVAAFRLPLPKSVIRRLEALPPRHALRTQLTIRITDEGGAVTDTTRPVALKGRKQPHRGQ